MHVHTIASGECKTPFVSLFSRESYTAPLEAYSLLRQRGMDLVTLTDHDSIEGAEQLRHRADFFLSEELTCTMPSGTEAHVAVYDIAERQHLELLRRRNDLPALLAYLDEQKIFFSINHIFSCLTGARHAEDFQWFQDHFPALEARNGAMLARQNGNSEELARQWRKFAIGGSDAHAAASAGRTYTDVPGARNKEEFLAGLRAGKARVGGDSGSYLKLTRVILLVGAEMVRDNHWKAFLAPLALLVPGFTVFNYISECRFGERWAAEVLEQAETRAKARWKRPQAAAEELL